MLISRVAPPPPFPLSRPSPHHTIRLGLFAGLQCSVVSRYVMVDCVMSGVQPGFQEQVRKQMVDSDLRRSSTVDVVDGRHMMEQLRSNADHKCACLEWVGLHRRASRVHVESPCNAPAVGSVRISIIASCSRLCHKFCGAAT